MKLAIVGSTSLAGNAEAKRIIRDVLDELRPDCVVSGGAIGIDTMAVEEANRREIGTLVHWPVGKGWSFYKERNLRIAKDCDHLVRIVAVNAKTYGSGWTRDRAAEMGKPTREYVVQLQSAAAPEGSKAQ